MLLAQISDLHLDGSDRARDRTSRVMDHLRSLPRPVDALLVTGDIADHAAETLAWIDATLGALPDGVPALIAFHHPLADATMLQEPERLAALLDAHPRVVAVLTGHAHTAAAATFAGRPLIVGPAVTWTLRLPWEGDRPADRDQPPGLAFHVLGEDRRLTTHFRVVL
ncbi:metallophosphoesterase [Streptomyces parvus]|uniref:metallophosphoesterase n=1 Tax=Streptomyces parvus TaxID=66428 RepID=UPI003802911D